jgi:hypothetical protein
MTKEEFLRIGKAKKEALDMLKKANPDLFANTQCAEAFVIYLAGRNEKKRDKVTGVIDPNGAEELSYLLTSRPSAGALATGKIFITDYFNASFEPVKTIEVKDGIKIFGGVKKPQTGVVFSNDQTQLFNFIKEALETKDGYTPAGIDAKKNPLIRLKAGVMGKIITMNVPPYVPHQWVDDKPQPLVATRRNQKDGSYYEQEVIMTDLTFFADVTDLRRLETVAVAAYENQVQPHVIDADFVLTVPGGNEGKKVEILDKEKPVMEPSGVDGFFRNTGDGDIYDDQGVFQMKGSEFDAMMATKKKTEDQQSAADKLKAAMDKK